MNFLLLIFFLTVNACNQHETAQPTPSVLSSNKLVSRSDSKKKKKPTRTKGQFGFPFCKKPVKSPSIDKNGYNYGWENGVSCIVKTTPRPTPIRLFGFPICTFAVDKPSIDDNGYAYGWDKKLNESCIIPK